MNRWLCIISCLLLARAAPANIEGPTTFDLGFIAGRYTDINGEEHIKALGPFFEHVEAPDGRTMYALRPLHSNLNDPEREKQVDDWLWPFISRKRFQDDHVSRYLWMFTSDKDVTDDDASYHRRLTPFYYQGRNADGESYFALWPLGGKIHDFFLKDDIVFFLWPLYTKTRVDDLKQVHVLWPVFTWGEGDEWKRFRMFPLYGRIQNFEAQYDRRFALWPIFTCMSSTYPGVSGSGYIVWPLWGKLDFENQQTRWLVPPFFRSTTLPNQRIVHAPWPFIQYGRGDVNKLYIWPLWGHRESGPWDSTFFLWPIVKSERYDGEDLLRKRFSVFPLWWSDVTWDAQPEDVPEATITAGEPLQRSFKLWPLMRYRARGDEKSFRMLALWPLKNAPAVERNLAPLWTLYAQTSRLGHTDRELLWGLYRSHRRGDALTERHLFPLFDSRRVRGEEDASKWSILKGLVGYEREGTQKTFRLLYFIRLGGKDETK